MNVADLRYRCRHCAMVFFVVGPRLTEDAPRMLRDHVRLAHPHIALPVDAHAGLVLQQFDVVPEEAEP